MGVMVSQGAKLPEVAREFERALLDLNRTVVERIVRSIDGDADRVAGLEQVIVPALEAIGQAWERGDASLSQVYMSGRICEEIVDSVVSEGVGGWRGGPRAALVVLEDYHLLGKRLVSSVLRSAGFSLLDYGRMTVDEIVRRVAKDDVEVILLSTLMLASALRVEVLRERLLDAGLDVKIVVGGAPFRFDERLWRDVGADACGRTASEAVTILEAVIGGE